MYSLKAQKRIVQYGLKRKRSCHDWKMLLVSVLWKHIRKRWRKKISMRCTNVCQFLSKHSLKAPRMLFFLKSAMQPCEHYINMNTSIKCLTECQYKTYRQILSPSWFIFTLKHSCRNICQSWLLHWLTAY